MNKYPRGLQPVCVQPPKTTSSAVTTDYLNAGKAHRVTFNCTLTQASAHATTISVYQAKTAAGASAKAITNTMPIYSNENIASNSYLTKQTDATTYSVTADAANKLIVIKVDPSLMDLAGGFKFLALHTTASSKATNFVNVNAQVETRHDGYDQVDLLS